MNASRQAGASLLIVLVLLTVLLLGSLAMARSDLVSTLIAGNVAARNAALQASEVGLADAYAQVLALGSEESNQPSIGYYATRQAESDSSGVPDITWADMPSTTIGRFTVRRVIERLCTGSLPVVDPARYCVLAGGPPLESSSKAGADALGIAVAKQYRVTVRVANEGDDLHAAEVIVQDLVVR